MLEYLQKFDVQLVLGEYLLDFREAGDCAHENCIVGEVFLLSHLRELVQDLAVVLLRVEIL
jgi:hypothetical protein